MLKHLYYMRRVSILQLLFLFFVLQLSVRSFAQSGRDTRRPQLVSQSVSDNDIPQPISGSMLFSFDEPVLVATHTAQVNGLAFKLSANGKHIALNYSGLPYNSVVSVNLPNGCITDTVGNPYEGTVFFFKTATRSLKMFDIVVDKNGKGRFTRLQDAIDAVPNNSPNRTLIYVRQGVYNEKLTIPEGKNNISIIGENVDNTIITWNECSSTATPKPGTSNSYTMLVAGEDFYAENLTIRNDYDYLNGTEKNKQAVALENRGDKQVFKNCKMYSYQDTHYLKDANKRQYFANCFIQGRVDFIFGSATAYFDSCTVSCIGDASYITAAAKTENQFGLVFNKCIIVPEKAKLNNRFYLGRPWGENCKTAFLNSKMHEGIIQPAGWSEWKGKTTHLSATYTEYNSRALNGKLMPVEARVAWSKQLDAQEASHYIPETVFNFGEQGAWNPKAYTSVPNAPLVDSLSWTGRLSWAEQIDAAGYLVFCNDSLVATAVSAATVIRDIKPSNIYSVCAYNEYGALSAPSAAVQVGLRGSIAKLGVLQTTVVETELLLQNYDYYATIEIVNKNGQRLLSSEIHGSSVYIGNLPKGTYYARACTKVNECRIEAFIKK